MPLMNDEINEAVKAHGGWSNLERQVYGKKTKNIKRRMFSLVSKLNGWLGKVGLELHVKPKNEV